MAQGVEVGHMCLGGEELFPRGDGGVGSTGISFFVLLSMGTPIM